MSKSQERDWLQVNGLARTPNGVAVVQEITEDYGVNTSNGNFCRSRMSEFFPLQYESEFNSRKVPNGSSHYLDGYFYNINGTTAVISEGAGSGNQYSVLTFSQVLDKACELPILDMPDWDDAPSWADRMMRKHDWIYFCNVEQYMRRNKTHPSAVFVFGASKDNYTIGDFELIEMRSGKEYIQEPAPTVNEMVNSIAAPFLPEVGAQCDVKRFHESESAFMPCYIVGDSMDEKWLIFEVLKTQTVNQACKINGAWEFRKSRTKAQIEKERFMNAANTGISFDMKYLKVVRSVLEQLGDNGFLAPEKK